MFKAFYGLTFDPFEKDVEIKNFYKSREFNQALSRLEFLKTTRGIGVITGEPGTGKSSLIRYYTSSLNSNLFKCVYIPISTLTVMDFYRALCNGLGIIPSAKKVTMFSQIQEAIYNYSVNKNITPVIIIDEAQFLKNDILDDLRILFNFNIDSKDYAILILLGHATFINHIQMQNHEALRQRIAVNYYLGGLNKEEVKEFIISRLSVSGCSDPLFTPEGFELLFSITNGSIRRLSSLARMCLISGASKQTRIIDNEIIFAAKKELDIIS